MKKILTIILLTFLLTGCAQGNSIKNPLTIDHKLGTTTLTTNPEKVVIFDLGILDIFDSLKLPVGAVPKSNLTTSLKQYRGSQYLDAGTLFEPNYEALAEYQPDLIIISGRASSHFEALSEIAPTIYLGTGTSDKGLLASIENNIKTLEKIYPNTRMNQQFEQLQRSINEIRETNLERPKSTMFILANGDTISSFGPGSRYDHVFNEFGFQPVNHSFESSSHGDKLSFELVAKLNPELIIVMDRGQIAGSEITAQQLMNNEFVVRTNAYKNNKIVYVNPESWYLTEGGIQSLENAVKELKTFFE